MSTRAQLIGVITIASAFVVATTVTPETASAFFFYRPTRGAPEVDPGTLGSAIALALGGLAVLSDKLRRR